MYPTRKEVLMPEPEIRNRVANQEKAKAKVMIFYNSKAHDLESICRYIQNASSSLIAFAVGI